MTSPVGTGWCDVFAEHPDLLLGDLERVIVNHARGFERSQQVELGPSEVGNTCERRVAMTMLGAPRPNGNRDEWTSSVGTACHAWMEKAFERDNRARVEAGKPPRWLIEQTVEIRPGLIGHTDIVDLETMTVLDHKFPGVTSIRKYRKAGKPGEDYITQAQLYAYGWRRIGLPIRKTAIAMYPRSGLIRDTWLWQADYDEDVALAGLNRVDGLLIGMNTMELAGQLPVFLDALGRDTTNCSWCAYFDPKAEDPEKGCKGPFYDPDHVDPKAMSVPGILQ